MKNLDAVILGKDALLIDAAHMLRDRRVGSVVVTDGTEQAPIGIVTARDIVLAVFDSTIGYPALTIGDVMKRTPESWSSRAAIGEEALA